MATRKILAREFTIEVESATPDTYLEIGGLRTIGFSPSKSDADTTDFNSAGFEEHLVASRGATWTFSGHYLEDSADGSRDAGQERCEALALLVGASSLGTFRVTTPGGTTYTFDGSVDATFPAGGTDDPTSWSVTIKQSGSVTKA